MDEQGTVLSFFRQFGQMSPEAQRDLLSACHYLTKGKGSHIITQGQTIPNLFIIEQGLVRSYYLSGDKEITVWFGYEGQNFASTTSFFENKPSRENVQCLENCRFVSISGNELNDLYRRHNDLNTIGRKIVELYCQVLDERSFSLQTQSARERYENLMLNDPGIIRRAPLGQVASFLGLSQETLSRARSKQLI